MTDSPILQVRGLSKHYPIRGGLLNRQIGTFRAVDDVSFSVPRGKTLGIVGESGSGKTTVGKCILRLIEPTAGEVLFEGQDLRALSGGELRRRRTDMQMIYQSPAASLNGRMTIGQIVGEALWLHERLNGERARRRVMELLEIVGLKAEHYDRFPHEFSGGQQQRVGIARALAVKPKLLVLDEPTSALDVSVQAQVLNIMKDLQRERGLTYLFISHNLAVVRHVSDEVGVMYLGRLVELSPKAELFSRPQHPYTRMLLDAIPDIRMTGRARTPVQGEVPNPLNPPSGCAFHPRCPHANERCARERPALQSLKGIRVACHAGEEWRI